MEKIMFEGSEKKLEIIFSKNSPSLRSLPQKFWEDVVRACSAHIVSTKKYPLVDSYILSESSMFVWDHRLILITCGQTTLAHSLLEILKHASIAKIETLFFQRKNEFFPRDQKSNFQKDVDLIQNQIQGTSYQFGSLHDHHFFLFCSSSQYQPLTDDATLEVLMYDSQTIKDGSKKSLLNLENHLEKIFPEFDKQNHFFNPEGYSMNAIKDEFYYTIHVTPQKPFFYVSFETNHTRCSSQAFIDDILNLFQTKNCDLIVFQKKQKNTVSYQAKNLLRNNFYQSDLECGYQVSYMNFKEEQKHPQKPKQL